MLQTVFQILTPRRHSIPQLKSITLPYNREPIKPNSRGLSWNEENQWKEKETYLITKPIVNLGTQLFTALPRPLPNTHLRNNFLPFNEIAT